MKLLENEIKNYKTNKNTNEIENENFTKKLRSYKNRLKIINYFIQTKTSPEWMTIKYLPVLPPNIRPIVKLQDKTIIASDLNFLYAKIVESNNKIQKLRKMSVPEYFLNTEKNILQETVDKLINNEKTEKIITKRDKERLKKKSKTNKIIIILNEGHLI